MAYLNYLKLDPIATLPSNPDHLLNLDASQEQLLCYIDVANILRYILSNSGIPDFTIDDLLYPNPKRSKSILAVLDNYVSFYDQKEENVKEAVDSITEMVHTYQGLLKKQEELRQKVNNLATNRALRANRKKIIKEKIKAEKKPTYAVAYKEASETYDSFNARVHSARQKLESKKEINMRKRQEIADLKKQVAPSPEQLKAELNKSKSNLEKLKEVVEERKCYLKTQTDACTQREKLIHWEHRKDSTRKQAKALNEALLVEQKSDVPNIAKSEVGDELEALQEEIAGDRTAVNCLQEEWTGLQLQIDRKLDSLTNSVVNEEKEKNKVESRHAAVHLDNEDFQKLGAQVMMTGTAYLQQGLESAEIFQNVTSEVMKSEDQKEIVIGQQWEITLADLKRVLDDIRNSSNKSSY